MARPNMARAARQVRRGGKWEMVEPSLTKGHMGLPDVVDAYLPVLQALSGRGSCLGRGNFGVAWRVETDDGPVVVKVPASSNIHGRPWSLAEMRRNLMHEAGNANELAERGYTVVPRAVYLETKEGLPALVREYGERARWLTHDELVDLEQQLTEIERTAGWSVHDDLDPYRRADGSVFIGDVGIWEPTPKGGTGIYAAGESSDLDHLVPALAASHVGDEYEKMASLSAVERGERHLREGLREGHTDLFVKLAHKHLRKVVASREKVGMPVPAEVYETLAKAERQLGAP
jgi:hypothetical protein